MVEHFRSADQIVAEAIAIYVDTEGMNPEDIEAIEDALYWALLQVGVI